MKGTVYVYCGAHATRTAQAARSAKAIGALSEKEFILSENGQSRTKFKRKSNRTCHSKPGGYAACRPSLACSLASTLVLFSIFLPQTKTLPEFCGKCVQIYRTARGAVFQQPLPCRPKSIYDKQGDQSGRLYTAVHYSSHYFIGTTSVSLWLNLSL
ncbi:MAG: hypothetical protein OXE52_00300, partial [Chloroflexi bacterium]|nr:hypothetical protein [Chloroflexota bacterium]